MSEQLKPFYLHHLAVCDEDGLRWMTGRCMPAGIDSVELYAAKDFGRAPELVLKADAYAALAAKDARISELEKSLVSMVTHHFDTPSGVSFYIDRARALIAYHPHYVKFIASQQHAEPYGHVDGETCTGPCGWCEPDEPATPSEDGGEVLASERAFEAAMPGYKAMVGDAKASRVAGRRIEQPSNMFKAWLECCAQHSRIVSAKDAEIARLSTLVEAGHKLAMDAACAEISALEAELADLRAQPARQVDGDEREQYEAFYAERAKTLPLPLGNSPVRYAGGQYVNDFALFGWMVWCERAALAPATVVIPECKKFSVATTVDRAQWKEGYNEALNEVARLNRNAIPEGLIEASRRAADILGSQGFAAWDQLAAELRALLAPAAVDASESSSRFCLGSAIAGTGCMKCPACVTELKCAEVPVEKMVSQSALDMARGDGEKPYGWVAVGVFYTDREVAIQAAGKTPCIAVYTKSQIKSGD